MHHVIVRAVAVIPAPIALGGCGDGRIVVAAAERYGARAVGYAIDPARVLEARANVSAQRVEHLVRAPLSIG